MTVASTARPATSQRAEEPARPATATLTITRVVHASVLLDFAGIPILTDPWFSQLAGHRWGEPLGVALANLPRLAGVVVSHKDYDHYDMATFAAYPHKDVPIVLRRGTGAAARAAGFGNLSEIEPWEQASVGTLRVTAAPALHKEHLGVMQNTYIIEAAGFCVYFGGDSLPTPHLAEVARRFPQIDLALLPTNGLSIRPLGGRRVVMNAEEAAQACALLRPRYAVPIHYRYTTNIWRGLLISMDRSPAGFVAAARRLSPNTAVQVLDTGAPLQIAPR
jgi:L-ascorbate metabolism protein UlaG (beta-lactamase superfamily)